MTVGTDPEMSPRTPLLTVPYAFRVSTIDGSAGGSVGGNINLTYPGQILLNNSRFIRTFSSHYFADNTFVGYNSGGVDSVGPWNTGVGQYALRDLTRGYSNTAIGAFALLADSSGAFNTACGTEALESNTTGMENTAVGSSALLRNIDGRGNTACGLKTLTNNESGDDNAAFGEYALLRNTAGYSNTAVGGSALGSNTTGNSNTAVGGSALGYNTMGSNNTAVGWAAGVLPSDTDLTNTTAIGYMATVTQSNMIRLGDGGVSLICGQVAFTACSDRNQKENFRPVDGEEVLRKIQQMELTSWNYRNQDPGRFRHYGPVAQEFYAAFGQDEVGTCGDSVSINSGDMAGILMIAVQALERRTAEVGVVGVENAELRAALAELRTEIAELRQKLGTTGATGATIGMTSRPSSAQTLIVSENP
jgi:hypothetical protein